MKRGAIKKERAADRPPADIAAAEAFWPVDQVDRLVGPLVGLLDGLTKRGDVEDTAAVGEDAPVFFPGAGVEHHDVLDRAGILEPPDLASLLVMAGIAPSRHDHGKRRLLPPF